MQLRHAVGIPSAGLLPLSALALALLAAPVPAAGQACTRAMPSAHAPLLAELLRAREVALDTVPTRFLSRASDQLATCADLGGRPGAVTLGPIDIALAPTDAALTFNGGYADDRNNGALWAGRGVSLGVQTGVLARIGWLSVGLQPVLTFQENRDFGVTPHNDEDYSEFANSLYTHRIDLPYRFGDGSFASVHAPGQSFARIDAFGLALGFGSENYWVGPALRNPILMSNTAAGFSHVFVGTTRPLDLWIARISAEVVLGRTSESDYWDADPTNDRGDIAMWVLGVQPRWLEGLELGASRLVHYRVPDPRWYGSAEQLLDFFTTGGSINIAGNELASVFGRWVMRESGAEVYFEWGRDDRFEDITNDLIPEIEMSQGYTIGFQKLGPLGSRTLRFHAEVTHLQEKSEPRGPLSGRIPPIYYLHHQSGHTHRGQLMGAAIGPGADAQYLALDLLDDDRGFGGFFVERVRRHDTTRQAVQARAFFPFEHDTELTGGVRGLLLWRDLAIGGSLSYSHRWNREFFEDDSNLRLVSELTWRPGLPGSE